MDEVKKDMKFVGVREEDGEDRVRQRQVGCRPPDDKRPMQKKRKQKKKVNASAWVESEGVCHGDGRIVDVNETFGMESLLDVFHRFLCFGCVEQEVSFLAASLGLCLFPVTDQLTCWLGVQLQLCQLCSSG